MFLLRDLDGVIMIGETPVVLSLHDHYMMMMMRINYNTNLLVSAVTW